LDRLQEATKDSKATAQASSERRPFLPYLLVEEMKPSPLSFLSMVEQELFDTLLSGIESAIGAADAGLKDRRAYAAFLNLVRMKASAELTKLNASMVNPQDPLRCPACSWLVHSTSADGVKVCLRCGEPWP
jgi:hypothetical protein